MEYQDTYRDNLGRFIKGCVFPEDIIEKMSNGSKGRIFSEEHKRKLSEASKKREIFGMLGKKHSEEAKRKMSLIKIGNKNGIQNLDRTGIKHTIETRLKMSKSKKGDKSYQWKGGTTLHRKRNWKGIEVRLWREKVFQRDNFICQGCDREKIYLEVHHIESWRNYPDKRFDVDNGITFCVDCHKIYDRMRK